jgi:hypothetical protein
MAIYRFRITFEDYDDVVREIELKTNQTFADLHKAILKSTGYNAEVPSSFFVSTDNWIKGEEIAWLPGQRKIDRGVLLMEKSKLSSFVEDPHQKFYYVYNFDRPYDFHVELVKIILENDPAIEYPYLAKSVGLAPKIADSKNVSQIATGTADAVGDFDFLNEMDFVPEDSDELEAMNGRGIVADEETEDEDEQDEFDNSEDDEYSSNNYDSEDY